MSQSRWESFTEILTGSSLNICVALIFNVTVLPWLIGMPVAFLLGAKITGIYTVASLAIRFGVRRFFNARVRRKVRKLQRGGGSIQSIPRSGGLPFVWQSRNQDSVAGGAGATDADRPTLGG